MILPKIRRRYLWASLAIVAVLVGGGLAGWRTYQDLARRDALWRIISTKCVPGWQERQQPAPCARVDLTAGTVILKDLVGVAQFLAMPTARISGIESPALLGASAPNIFAAGWKARALVEDRLHKPLPRHALSLAINSTQARSQDQAHVHVDCLRSTVDVALRELAASLPANDWAREPVLIDGRRYGVMRLDRSDLDGINVFDLAEPYVRKAGATMSRATIVVVGATTPGGGDAFLIIVGIADPARGDRGHGEDLKDHSCAVAAP
jgi:CDP-diacylglycerol pyrophosphatase